MSWTLSLRTRRRRVRFRDALARYDADDVHDVTRDAIVHDGRRDRARVERTTSTDRGSDIDETIVDGTFVDDGLARVRRAFREGGDRVEDVDDRARAEER